VLMWLHHDMAAVDRLLMLSAVVQGNHDACRCTSPRTPCTSSMVVEEFMPQLRAESVCRQRLNSCCTLNMRCPPFSIEVQRSTQQADSH
jgi:hypothetical protein